MGSLARILHVDAASDGVVVAVPGHVGYDHVVEVGLLYLCSGLARLVRLVLDVAQVALQDASVVDELVVRRDAVCHRAACAGEVVDACFEVQHTAGDTGLGGAVLGSQPVAVEATAEVAGVAARCNGRGVEPNGGAGVANRTGHAAVRVALQRLGVPCTAGDTGVPDPLVPGEALAAGDGCRGWERHRVGRTGGAVGLQLRPEGWLVGVEAAAVALQVVDSRLVLARDAGQAAPQWVGGLLRCVPGATLATGRQHAPLVHRGHAARAVAAALQDLRHRLGKLANGAGGAAGKPLADAVRAWCAGIAIKRTKIRCMVACGAGEAPGVADVGFVVTGLARLAGEQGPVVTLLVPRQALAPRLKARTDHL
eukprot:762433-Hanusia_phi.AAC.21